MKRLRRALALNALFIFSFLTSVPAVDVSTLDREGSGIRRAPAPALLRAEAVSPFQINLAWPNKTEREVNYQLERCTDGHSYSQIAQLFADTTTFRDVGLFPETTYFYRIRASTVGAQSAYSNPARAQTPPTECPLSIAAWDYYSFGESPLGQANVVAIAEGSYHRLALRRDGTVIGWGDNSSGQASAPTNLTDAVAIAAGETHSIALKRNGTVVCWGANGDALTRPPTNLTGVVAIAAGSYHSLALKNDGTVVGWGYDDDFLTRSPANLTGVIAIAAGVDHNLALKCDGTVVGWGQDYNGQASTPAGLSNVVAIAARQYYSLALKRDGSVVGWGYSDYAAAVPPADLTNAVAIAAGYNHSLALRSDGTVMAWGYVGSPDPSTGLSNVVAIAAGNYHSLALTTLPAPPAALGTRIINQNLVRLTWTDDSPNEDRFEIERATNNIYGEPGDWTVIGTVPAGVTTFDDGGVVTNMSCSYRLRAHSPCGYSVARDRLISNVRPPDAPYQPGVVIGTTTNHVELSWYTYSGNIDGFKLERAPDANGSPGAWTEIAAVTATNINYENKYTDTVAANSTYWYRLRAFNVLGDSEPGSSARITVGPPSAPYYFYGYSFADRAILNWGTSDYYEGILGFRIERAPDAAGSPGTWAEIATLEVTNFNGSYAFSDPGLRLDDRFWYRVRSFNWVGDSLYTFPVSVLIVLPAAPQSLAGSVGTTNSVNLNWYESNGDQDGFKIERAPDVNGVPGIWTEINSLSLSNTTSGSYTDTNVLALSTNWYRVRAYNVLGLSPYSDPLRVPAIPPPAPTLYAATFSDTVNLSWYVYYSGLIGGFVIERAPDVAGAPGAWTQVTNLVDSAYTDRHLTPNATYWYRVKAYNWTGASPFSEPVSVTIVPPVAPTSFTANIGVSNQVDLSWYHYPPEADGFQVERAPDVGGAAGTWTRIATINAVNSTYGQFADTNVTRNTTVWYRVRAFNVVGLSPYSTPVRLELVPPAAPIGLAASPRRDQITVTWYDDSGGVMGFKVERASDTDEGPGPWTEIAKFNPSYNNYGSFTDTNRAADSTTWYRVRAYNWIGDSPYSDPIYATIVPPAQPSYIYASVGTTNRVNLSWYDYQGDQDGFVVERAPSVAGNPGGWTDILTLLSSSYGYFNAVDTNVTANTTNWYRVRAFSVAGVSAPSAATSVAIVPPSAPYYIYAQPQGARVILYWNNSYNGEISGYKIERAEDAGGNPGTWIALATITNNVTSYTDTGRALGVKYWYRVRAYNWIGQSPFSDPTSVIIVGPAAPNSLSGTLGTTNSINLSWYQNPADEDGFKIERAPEVNGVRGLWTEIATVFATNSYYGNYTDTNVLANTVNWYRVRAFNGLGLSPYSDPARVPVAPPVAPESLSGTPFRDQINLSWYIPDSYTAAIIGSKLERAPDVGGVPGAWAQIATILGQYYPGFTDTNRAANTAYWYRVRTFNWVGNSPYSVATKATIVPPSAPTSLAALIGTTNSVNLTWYDYVADQDGFRLERAPNVGSNPGAWTQIAVISATNYYYGNYTDTNVLANTTNWYRVRAFSRLGISAYTPPLRVPVIPPPAPSYLSASPSSDRVNLYWYGDYYYNYGEVGGYKLERAPGANGPWSQFAVLTNNYTTSYTDTGRALGSTNWYRVRAYNWIGDGLYSTVASATIVPPATPSSLYGNMGTTNRVDLSWYHNSADADGFRIERAPNIGGLPGTWTEIGTANVTNNYYANYADTNAPSNTTNWYRVRAFNALGMSAYSDPASVAVIPPSKPYDLRATIAISPSIRVQLNWYLGSERIDAVVVERALDTNGVPGNWSQIARFTSGYYYNSLTDTRVKTNGAYWYRVRASNWVGSSPNSDFVTVRIAPPPAPTDLSAHGLRNQVNLTWQSNPSGVTGFRLERAQDNAGAPGTWTEFGSTYYFTTNYWDYGLTFGRTYWYRIRAYNALGDSPYSSLAKVTPSSTEELGAAVVDWNNVHQRIDGFGASSAWRSSWTVAQADMFFSTNTGIGLSLLRSRIRPDGGTDELTIMQLAQARGAKVWSTPWSPPPQFKDTGNVNGGNYKGGTATNQAYASQLARYVVNMKNQGINIYGLSIQNEPDLSTTSYESCYWSNDQFHEFVPYLYNTLAASNVSTKIILPETSYWSLYPATPTMTDPTTATMVDTLAAHGYYYSAYDLPHYGKTLWQTEDSTFDNHDGTINNGIYWGRRIHEYLTIAEVNAWHYWWLINANTSNEGLTDRLGNPAKRMYVLGQYSRFVRPNYYRIGVGNNSTALISSYKDPASTSFAIVAVNPNSDLSIQQTFTVANAPVNGTVTPWMTSSSLSLSARPVVGVTNGTFTFRLPPLSVVTFVGHADSLLRPGIPGQDIDPSSLPILSATAAGDQLALQIPCIPGTTYAVQVSSNMVDWTTVYLTNTPAAIFQWSDPEPKIWPSRFYRIQITAAAGEPSSTPPGPSAPANPQEPEPAAHVSEELAE